MDYNSLLDIAMKIAYRLAMSGAETFRIEESISRIMAAYHINAESFAIPNLLIINIATPEGQTLTRMRRIGYHGNDLDSVERYSNLSRRICAEIPDPQTAVKWIHEADTQRRTYRLPFYLAGNFLGACGFSIFFGSGFVDSFCAGICGLVVGLVLKLMNTLKVNQFFSTTVSAFIMTLTAYLLNALQLAPNTDAIIIGTLMILLPGLLFTNAMRDIILGDTNSGVNRIVQVLLIAVAIALGTAAAWSLANATLPVNAATNNFAHPYWLQCAVSFVGCIGFTILFNIHGPGGLLCATGGLLVWATYCIIFHVTSNVLFSNFIATVVGAIYSEVLARIRKYPAISYLVVSIFPLLPGAGIYYTVSSFVNKDLGSFVEIGAQTIAIAGVLAVGILLVSTAIRSWSEWMKQKKASV